MSDILEIKCPMCKGIIMIEKSTGDVVEHKAAVHEKVGFDDFLNAQKNKSSQWNEKMQKAKENELKKKERWEEKFKKAKEDPDSIEGEYHSPFELE
jgi:phage FluMu protein Com